jgi:tRNA-dihydrouridine synthase
MVKDAVLIPVFGNGNVIDKKSCENMIDTTGCDGVSLGRIAVVKPWIFASLTKGFVPERGTYLSCFINMANLFEKYFESVISVRLFKKFARYFAANFCFGHSLYTGIVRADNMAEIKSNILKYFEPMPEIALTPNMNMLM